MTRSVGWAGATCAWMVAGLLLAGCGQIHQSSSGASPGGPLKIATASEPHAFFPLARAQGDLHGQVNSDGTACLWITMNTHDEALLWPYGYTARGNPIAVYDDSGSRVALVGQQIVVGGAREVGVTSILGCSGFQAVWMVGSVSLSG